MSDQDKITEAVFHYFEGYKTKDRARLERAFDTNVAQMIGYSKRRTGALEMSARPITEVIDAWVDPGYQQLPFGEGKILAIDIFSDVAANVVFDCGGIFIDSFQMVKRDGTWRIANKFYADL
jgi:hypothetical protein